MARTPKVQISSDIRRRVLKRDGQRCRYCGSKQEPFHMDHVYPESKGGETTVNNLVTACGPCNFKKSYTVGMWPKPIGYWNEQDEKQRIIDEKNSLEKCIEDERSAYNQGRHNNFLMAKFFMSLGTLVAYLIPETYYIMAKVRGVQPPQGAFLPFLAVGLILFTIGFAVFMARKNG